MLHLRKSLGGMYQPPSAIVKAGGRLSCMLLLAIIGTGCGVDLLGLPGIATEILIGKDSAGAVVEIEKQGTDLVRARVIDIVLGTGEAMVVPGDNNTISFTVRFPAGAIITYLGIHNAAADGENLESIRGTWTQENSGIFEEDNGTWDIPGQ